jgi:uncharacterized membrane protein YkvA (DUF1232 family)
MNTSHKWLGVMLGLLVVLSAAPNCMAALSMGPRVDGSSLLLGSSVASMAAAPGLGGSVHRRVTRISNSVERLAGFFGQLGIIWLWALLSAGVFLLVTALSSVADVRMLDFRHQGVRALAHYVARGIRIFFRIVRDRHTPNLARCVLVLALLYWLLPFDLIPDTSSLPGFRDDLVIAVVGAKAFMWFCPDALIATHAHAIDSTMP